MRCDPKLSNGLETESEDNARSAADVGTAMAFSEVENEKSRMEFFSSPLILKPMYTMIKWRHPRTRDRHLAIFLVLPTGTVGLENGVQVELLNSEQLQLSFSWPPT